MDLLRTPMCLTLKGHTYTDEDENGDDDMQNIDREEVLDEDEGEEDKEDKEMYPDEEEEPLGLVWLHEMQVCIYHFQCPLVQIFS